MIGLQLIIQSVGYLYWS